MEKPMILIAEPVHFGDTHVQVNSAMLVLLKMQFPDKKISLVAENTHYQSIVLNTNEMLQGIAFYPFKKYSKNGLFYWYQKIVGEWKQIIKVQSLARRQNAELLVWLCLFPTGHLLIHLLYRLSFSKQQQLIVLHGEMEYFANAPKLFDKILRSCLRCAFKLANANTAYIVLGDNVKGNLEQYPFLPLNNIFSFPHPFLYHPLKFKNATNDPLKFCTFGTLKKSKNAHLFYEIAKRFSKEVKEGALSFNTIGKIFDDVKPYQNNCVRSYKPDIFLAQKEYEAEIAAQDFALFFYDSSMYQLSASGAFHEAINNGLPIISLQNDYFIKASNGNTSIKCFSSLDEMEHYISALIKEKEIKIKEQHLALSTFIQQNSFHLQSQKLKLILQKFRFRFL